MLSHVHLDRDFVPFLNHDPVGADIGPSFSAARSVKAPTSSFKSTPWRLFISPISSRQLMKPLISVISGISSSSGRAILLRRPGAVNTASLALLYFFLYW